VIETAVFDQNRTSVRYLIQIDMGPDYVKYSRTFASSARGL
jgi:hypothetical protein